MVNFEKPERVCESWRAVFDRDVNEEQCGPTTIHTVVVWGVLDGPALYDDFAMLCRTVCEGFMRRFYCFLVNNS